MWWCSSSSTLHQQPTLRWLCRQLVRAALLASCLCAPCRTLELLQWNPHWQCLAQFDDCRDNVKGILSDELVAGDIDFANIVELDTSYAPPDGWKSIHGKCGRDVIDLMYNSERWRPTTTPGSNVTGCMVFNDRPFIVQHFEQTKHGGSGPRRVIVVTAHFPHEKERDALAVALQSVVESTGVMAVVFMADTNEYRWVSSEQIMIDIQAPPGHWLSTDLQNTCCFDISGADSFNPDNTYDRVVANFGSRMSTKVLFDPLPAWAKVPEFHRGIRATLDTSHDSHEFANIAPEATTAQAVEFAKAAPAATTAQRSEFVEAAPAATTAQIGTTQITTTKAAQGEAMLSEPGYCSATRLCDPSCTGPGSACENTVTDGPLFGQAANCEASGCGKDCERCPQCQSCCCDAPYIDGEDSSIYDRMMFTKKFSEEHALAVWHEWPLRAASLAVGACVFSFAVLVGLRRRRLTSNFRMGTLVMGVVDHDGLLCMKDCEVANPTTSSSLTVHNQPNIVESEPALE